MHNVSRLVFDRYWPGEWGPGMPGEFRTEIPQKAPVSLESRIDGDRAPYRVAVNAGGIDPSGPGLEAARRLWAASLAAHRAGAGPAPGGELRVEIHMACGSATPENPLVLDDGSVFCQDPDLYHACLAAWASSNPLGQSSGRLRLRSRVETSMDRRAAAFQLEPLLLRHELPAGDVIAWLNARPEHSTLEVSMLLRTSGADIWGSSPQPGMAAFDTVFQPVSRALQAALRLWIPYLYFIDGARFDEHIEAWTFLVYSQMRLYRPKARNEFSYEVSDPREVREALHGMLPPLMDEMRRISSRIAAMKLPKELSQKYSQRRTPRMLAYIAGMPRLFTALLHGENRIMEAILRFGQEVGAGTRLRHGDALKAGSSLHRRLGQRLRRMCNAVDTGGLAGVLLVEATAALAASLGRPEPVEALLTLRDPLEGATYYAVNPHFRG